MYSIFLLLLNHPLFAPLFVDPRAADPTPYSSII